MSQSLYYFSIFYSVCFITHFVSFKNISDPDSNPEPCPKIAITDIVPDPYSNPIGFGSTYSTVYRVPTAP